MYLWHPSLHFQHLLELCQVPSLSSTWQTVSMGVRCPAFRFDAHHFKSLFSYRTSLAILEWHRNLRLRYRRATLVHWYSLLVLVLPAASIGCKSTSSYEISVKHYAIVIERAGSNYSAYVPDLPGCIAAGATSGGNRATSSRSHRTPHRGHA